MQKIIAKFISIVFNPLLMPTLGVLILLNSPTYFSLLPGDAKKIIMLTIIISTFLLPISFLPLFIYQNIIQTISMKNRKERIVPFAVIFIMYAISYYLLRNMGVPATINNVILGGASTILFLTLLTLRWKISAHMAGIGALTGVLCIFSFFLKANFLPYIMLSILIAGFIGTSRIILKAHTPSEIYTGYGLGVVMVIATFLIV